MSDQIDFSRLYALGWKPFFANDISPSEWERFRAARVIEVQRGHYLVQTDQSEHQAVLPGRLRHRIETDKDFPTVGDWVLLEQPPGADKALIERLLPRFSQLTRGAAGDSFAQQLLCANVDTVLLVSSLNRDFNLRRLERYLVIVRNAGATPVVVLTKADLCDGPAHYLDQVKKRLNTDDAVALNALADDTSEALALWCTPGTTLACLGSSGVGKSTLINNLAGAERQTTQAVRAGDDKGRHTTTRRSLFQLPGSLCVIDTPGMRELKLPAEAEAVQAGFADVEKLIAGCRFGDCTHANEPGCTVREALASGMLSKERWRNYQRLAAEQQTQVALAQAHHERRQREKTFGKMARNAQRTKQRNRYGE